MPPVAQAQVVVAQSRGTSAQKKSQQLNKLLEQGASWWRLKILQARSLFINGSYRGAKNPRIFLALATYRLVRKFSAAVAAYRQAVAPTPTMPIFSMHWLQSGNLEDNAGGDSHRRTIELDRNYLNAYLDWCGAVASGNYNAALWAYQQVFAREPNNANAYELMGAMLMQQGRSKEAIAAPKSQQRWF